MLAADTIADAVNGINDMKAAAVMSCACRCTEEGQGKKRRELGAFAPVRTKTYKKNRNTRINPLTTGSVHWKDQTISKIALINSSS